MNRYKPGQAFTMTATFQQGGIYVDPPNLTITVWLPGPSTTLADGTTTTVTPVRDSIGKYHADFAIPFPSPPGKGVYRWRSSGAVAAQNENAEVRFEVLGLDF